MEAVKPEEISHPPMDQLQGLEYCIDSNPSWGEAVALGFQHYILSLGTAVMIPTFLVSLMGGSDGDKARVVQTLLFVQGINTLLQTLFGTRLPTVIGASYAYMVPIISIIHDSSLARIEDPHVRFNSTMRAVQGALIVASSLQIILGYSQLWAICSRWEDVLKLAFHAHIVCCLLSDKQLPMLERFALLLSVTVIWAYAHLLTASGAYKHRPVKTQMNCRTDKANLISTAPWIKIPYPLQWGAPSFDAGHAFGMMAAVLVSLIDSSSSKCNSTSGSCFESRYRLAGYWDLNEWTLWTLSGSAVSIENVGLIGSTRVGSRRVIQISAGFMIFFSMLGKFGALFASIPFTIFAAMYCVFFGLVGSVGLSFLQFTNMNSMRNLFITGVSMFLGLSIPNYFREYTASALHGPSHTRAGWFNDFLNTIFSSSPAVSLIVSVLLDNTLDYKDSARDRGMPWWVKFRTFKGDSRNEEFYTLPFNLNRFFPPS
ncbi:Nucleobase-ascorbate transporter 2 [Bienertia sinuspersici]